MTKEKDKEFPDLRVFDVRTLERNIEKGAITRKDYERYLKSLDDSGERARRMVEEPSPEQA